MVRISGGRLKGRRIVASKKVFAAPGGDELRPTSAKVREAIFNIMQAEIQHALFLDLYAGTGAVGLEALSRGAEKVFFVEDSKVRCKAVMDYIHRLNLDDKTAVYQEKAEAFLMRAMRTGLNFDIIFADPPYLSDELGKVLPYIGEYRLLKEGGCVLVEHYSKSILPDGMPLIRLIKQYRYGDTMITLYRKES